LIFAFKDFDTKTTDLKNSEELSEFLRNVKEFLMTQNPLER
jgi:hypothetical protein